MHHNDILPVADPLLSWLSLLLIHTRLELRVTPHLLEYYGRDACVMIHFVSVNYKMQSFHLQS